MQQVVVTGIGTVCPLGHNTTEFWTNLSSGKNGVGPITRFDATDYPVQVAAEVKDFDPTKYLENGVPHAERYPLRHRRRR